MNSGKMIGSIFSRNLNVSTMGGGGGNRSETGPGHPFFYSLKNPEVWKEKGDGYFRAGDYENALECYCQAIEIRPDYHEAWNNRGYALFRLGRIEEARTIKALLKDMKRKDHAEDK
jgi:tetratricopeptide (TPR) repeat protein